MSKKQQIEKEIKKILAEMATSFAEKNSEKYMNLFAKKADIVIYGSQEGEKWTSLKDYLESVNRNWAYAEKITVTYDWLTINNSGDVAWIATDVIFKSKIGKQTMSVSGRMTAVFVREKDNWKIAQSHFSMENKSS